VAWVDVHDIDLVGVPLVESRPFDNIDTVHFAFKDALDGKCSPTILERDNNGVDLVLHGIGQEVELQEALGADDSVNGDIVAEAVQFLEDLGELEGS
jgi:hypothetical protein